MNDLIKLLEDPLVFGINKLPARAFSWPSNRTELQPDEFLYDVADWRISLDGEWKFHWSPAPDGRVEGFETPGFDDSAWNAVELPCNLECNGYGTPIYSNITYPFHCDPPHVMGEPPADWTTYQERNPTGQFRRKVALPADWSGRRTVIHFGGAQTAFRLWVNGEFAGYSEDSMGVAEFEITPFLRAGENLIAAELYKYSSASYLEDQDFWRLSGFFRSIFLYSTGNNYIADAVIRADSASRNIIAVTRIEGEGEVELLVRNPGGEAVDLPLDEVEFWSPEQPALYLVTLVLKNNGKIEDIRHYRTGFRTIEIRDRQVFFNGKAIHFHGVNRHEFDPERGRALTREGMMKDVAMIKAANLDSVRCSHYMNHPLWYELCDRNGIWLVDEANVESHGLSYHACVLPGDEGAWMPATVDRAERMVKTNRNHVSVTVWSLGNEAGYGTGFEAAAARIRELDPRPIQYADMNIVADFDSQTYPTPRWLYEYSQDNAERIGEHGEIPHPRQHGPMPTGKPFIMNEYAHAMGNSTGNFFEYWEMIERFPCLAGGFIWEWCEHGFRSAKGYLYGGDFGDKPNDGTFCCDGLVRPNRIPNPGLAEVKFVHQPLAGAIDRAAKTVTLRNKRYFLPLKNINWKLLRNGVELSSGVIEKVIPAGGSVTIPYPAAIPESGEVFFRFAFEESAELELCATWEPTFSVLPDANPFWTGKAESYRCLFEAEIVLDRAITDNDHGCKFDDRTALRKPEDFKTSLEWSGYLLKAGFEPGENCPEIARFGVRIILPEEAIANVAWYGRGPHEAYCDRKRSALVGRYESAPGELATPYTRPQENGQRIDVRELILTSASGDALCIASDRLFGFTLRNYRAESLEKARHSFELEDEGIWELTLDVMHRGAGGDNSWGLDVHDEYKIPREKIEALFLFSGNIEWSRLQKSRF